MLSPDRAAFFVAIRQQVGEGHDQYNDDVFSSHDGRTIFVSRPSARRRRGDRPRHQEDRLARPAGGLPRRPHGDLADGTKLLVSASTANVVEQIDTATADHRQVRLRRLAAREQHSRDGNLVYHASIGRVYTPPTGPPVEPTSKGSRVFEVVDAHSLKILKTWDMGKKLEEAGYPGMSSAVRPMALAPDEKWLYFQVSFFHGFVEFDLANEKVTRLAKLPLSQEAAKMQQEDYLLDSAHHGLAINAEGTKLCAAGTMSDYAAIVDRKTFAARILDAGRKPYWSTNSRDGEQCYVSASGDDWLTVIDYGSEKILRKVPVGDHPQRVRNGVARLDVYPAARTARPSTCAPSTSARRSASAGGDENIGCTAAGAQELRLVRCEVRITARRAGRTSCSQGHAHGRRPPLVQGRREPHAGRPVAPGVHGGPCGPRSPRAARIRSGGPRPRGRA